MDALAETTSHSDAVFDLTVLMRVEATKDIAGKVEPGRKHVYAYTVFDADTGEVYLRRSYEPACDLARELLSRGITGKVRVVGELTGVPRYTIDIEKAAKLTVREDAKVGPVFVPWKPFSMVSEAAPSSTGEAKAVEATDQTPIVSKDRPVEPHPAGPKLTQ